MTAFALGVGAITLAVALLATIGLRLLPTLRLQLAGFALLAVLLPLLAVLFSGWVMFHMGDDVKILAIAAASAAAAVGTALVLGTSIIQRIDHLRRASAELAGGDLAARAPSSGPRELAELGRSFNDMASEIEGLFDARRELVAAASHDLRTPIASISAMLEAIDDGLAEPEEYLSSLREQAQRLGTLVEDLFDLARIDAGEPTGELRAVPLAPLVASCVRSLEAQARAQHVSLEQRSSDAPVATCSPRHVERVLLNLLTNALHHTPAGGTIAVLLRSDREEVRITVEDSGTGLSPETTRRMFDRFWREDSSRSSAGGSGGLGLAIARGLVEAQGGRIWAGSSPSDGATVSFTLRTAPQVALEPSSL